MTDPYELHPLCTLFPRLAGGEFDSLVADIKTNGLAQPIVLHEGMILDGGNRYRACIEAGIEPKFKEYEGSNLVSFVLSANLHRRHMSVGQQAAIVSSAADWAKAQSVGRPRKPAILPDSSGQGAALPDSDNPAILPLSTVADRSAESGASDRTQRVADKVAKADPELAMKVGHGEVSLAKAVAKVDGKPTEKTPEQRASEAEEKENWREAFKASQEEVETVRNQLWAANADNGKLRDQIKELQASSDQEYVKNLGILKDKIERISATRDGLMSEKADLIRENKMLRSKLKRAEAVA